MLQPRIYSREASLTTLATALNQLSLCARHAPKPSRPQLIFVRHASHAQQGRANGPKDSAGRRLGAKKTASQWVIPGNIIFKQRGTKWFPGENVGIGKDHTIYSQVYGYVRYYRNPAVHPKRRYIGVALEKEGQGSQLPTPHNAPTRRRLGMHAAPMSTPAPAPTPVATPTPTPVVAAPIPSEFLDANTVKDAVFLPQTMTQVKPFDPANSTRRGGYGVSNWQIGRAAEIKGINVKEFDRKDRWKAWRVRVKKIETKRSARAAKGTKKTKGKKSNKKVVL